MDVDRAVQAFTVGVIVVTMVASGPAVGLVDFTTAPTPKEGPTNMGTGSVDAEVVSVPTDGIILRKGSFGAGTYYLEAPDAVVRVESVRENPIIEYSLTIPALKSWNVNHVYLDESSSGTVNLSMIRGRFNPNELTNESYEARLTITIRGDENETLYDRNITVEVKG